MKKKNFVYLQNTQLYKKVEDGIARLLSSALSEVALLTSLAPDAGAQVRV